MSYLNAPPEVDGLKAMLLLCPTFTSIMASSNIHYPAASMGDSVAPDNVPMVVIEPSEDSPKVIAPAIVTPNGKLQVLLYMQDVAGADIEKKARAIKDELLLQPSGLPLLGARVGLASEPDGDFRSAQAYADENANGMIAAIRVIAIVITYGIT